MYAVEAIYRFKPQIVNNEIFICLEIDNYKLLLSFCGFLIYFSGK